MAISESLTNLYNLSTVEPARRALTDLTLAYISSPAFENRFALHLAFDLKQNQNYIRIKATVSDCVWLYLWLSSRKVKSAVKRVHSFSGTQCSVPENECHSLASDGSDCSLVSLSLST